MCMFRFLHLLASFFLGISAFVQHNDPDSTIWTTIYFVPATVSFCTSIFPSFTENNWIRGLNTTLIIACGLYAGFIFQKEYQEWEDDGILNWMIQEEEGREFSGLLIIILWTFFMHGTARYLGLLRMLLTSLIIVLPMCGWIYIYENEEFRRFWPVHCLTSLYPGTNNELDDDDEI